MNFLLIILLINIIIQYIIILVSKSFLSYNEELFLFLVYISLFILILISSENMIEKFVIRESIRLNEYYEKLISLKTILINNLTFYIKLLKHKENFIIISYISCIIKAKITRLKKNWKEENIKIIKHVYDLWKILEIDNIKLLLEIEKYKEKQIKKKIMIKNWINIIKKKKK